MSDVVMEMETGRMGLSGKSVAVVEKVRKFPDVPPELIARAKAMELKKQEFAWQKEKLGEEYYPIVYGRAKELCRELNALWVEIREMQRVAMVARRARERLKQTEAADRKARRAGNAT